MMRRTILCAILCGAMLSPLCAPTFAQEQQPENPAGFVALEHRSPEAMSAADRALWQAHADEIVRAALLHGYRVDTAWAVTQSVCPLFSDTVLLHYRRGFDDGTVSAFSAILSPRSAQVEIVDALHRNAADFLPSVKSARTAALFNALVPEEQARQAASARGQWLTLGLCYAELSGMQPRVPLRPAAETATIQAPQATLLVDDHRLDHTGYRDILFADYEIPHLYTAWTVSLNTHGQVIRGEAEDRRSAVSSVLPVGNPQGILLKPAPMPAGQLVPIGSATGKNPAQPQ